MSGRELLVATLAVSLTLALSLFVVFHTLLVLSGLSSIEAPVYGFGCCGGALGEGSPYHRGAARNWAQVFGARPWAWLLPIAIGDAEHWPELSRGDDAAGGDRDEDDGAARTSRGTAVWRAVAAARRHAPAEEVSCARVCARARAVPSHPLTASLVARARARARQWDPLAILGRAPPRRRRHGPSAAAAERGGAADPAVLEEAWRDGGGADGNDGSAATRVSDGLLAPTTQQLRERMGKQEMVRLVGATRAAAVAGGGPPRDGDEGEDDEDGDESDRSLLMVTRRHPSSLRSVRG